MHLQFAICQQLMSSCTLFVATVLPQPPNRRRALLCTLTRVPTSEVTGNVEMVPPTAWSYRSNDGKWSPSQKRALNFGTLESCHSHVRNELVILLLTGPIGSSAMPSTMRVLVAALCASVATAFPYVGDVPPNAVTITVYHVNQANYR